jgi:hypothetical protein
MVFFPTEENIHRERGSKMLPEVADAGIDADICDY